MFFLFLVGRKIADLEDFLNLKMFVLNKNCFTSCQNTFMRNKFVKMSRTIFLNPWNSTILILADYSFIFFSLLHLHHPAKYYIDQSKQQQLSQQIILIKQKQMRSHMREGSRLWDYQVLQQLGKGEYGQVFKVRNKKDGYLYALKRVNISSCHQKEKIQAFRQVKALKLIKHPDIIEYYQSFLSMDNIYIVMEYAAKGDFSKIVKQRKIKGKPFSEHQLWEIFIILTGAVRYLHQKGIIHRDLKLENIFMTQQGKIKLGDLGMCKLMTQSEGLISTRVGTPIYFAPQIIQHQLYSYPVDIWALGCVFYYLATLQHPFKEASIQTLSLYIIQRELQPIKGHYGGYMINFINLLLTKNSKQRPDIFQVGLFIKNRDNPNPPNKVMVFDFKKLLMMKPDLQKLDQMRKNYNLSNEKKSINDSSEALSRRQSFNGIKTYREFIKQNFSYSKEEQKQQLKKNNPQKNSNSFKNQKNVHSNYSIVSPKKSDLKVQKLYSPIKTNGFCESKIQEYHLKNSFGQSSYLDNKGKYMGNLRLSKRRYAS